MIRYVDTSAYLKLVRLEAESEPFAEALRDAAGDGFPIVSSRLIETEMHRAGHRLGVPRDVIDAQLAKLTLIEISPWATQRAGAFPDPHLRTLDAMHLAVAIECGAEEIFTYDLRLTTSARLIGIAVRQPGAERLGMVLSARSDPWLVV